MLFSRWYRQNDSTATEDPDRLGSVAHLRQLRPRVLIRHHDRTWPKCDLSEMSRSAASVVRA